nr:MAG TPA_asm: hypothetical protein [Caudoviricetes sp.]
MQVNLTAINLHTFLLDFSALLDYNQGGGSKASRSPHSGWK